MADESNLNDGSELGDGGIEALRKERAERKRLEAELKELNGRVKAGDSLATQLEESKQQLRAKDELHNQTVGDLRKEIESRDSAIASIKIEGEFFKRSGEFSLNSKYQALLLEANKSQFLVKDGQVVTTDGKSVTDWLESQRSQYPELFDAPKTSGSGMGTGGSRSGSTGGRRVVVSSADSSAYLNNLEGIANGSVVVE